MIFTRNNKRRTFRRNIPSGVAKNVTGEPPTQSVGAAQRSLRHTRRGASRMANGQRAVFPRRRKPAVIIRRAVLLGLMLLGLGLLTLTYRTDSNALDGPRMVVLNAVAPIERGLSRAWSPVQGSYDWVSRLIGATNENAELKVRVDELERKLSDKQVIEEENGRLRDLVALKHRGRFPAGYRQVVGSVIVHSPTSAERSIVIDLGTNDGISVDDPVMVTRGLIGRVSAVTDNAATVSLITNRVQAVSAVVVDSNAVGVVQTAGNEGSPVMMLDYVLQEAQVSTGDLVVTSGWSTGELNSVYPQGIPIGFVSSAGNSPADLYKTVQVTPFADFDRIDEVIVLVRRNKLAPITAFPPTAVATTTAAKPVVKKKKKSGRR